MAEDQIDEGRDNAILGHFDRLWGHEQVDISCWEPGGLQRDSHNRWIWIIGNYVGIVFPGPLLQPIQDRDRDGDDDGDGDPLAGLWPKRAYEAADFLGLFDNPEAIVADRLNCTTGQLVYATSADDVVLAVLGAADSRTWIPVAPELFDEFAEDINTSLQMPTGLPMTIGGVVTQQFRFGTEPVVDDDTRGSYAETPILTGADLVTACDPVR